MRALLVTALLGSFPSNTLLAEAPPALEVQSNYPGGSARVERIDQAKRIIEIAPGGKAERGWVCWWQCHVEGIQPGETITLVLHGSVWATPDRAAFSLDRKTWKQTGPGKREKDKITYQQVINAREAWFAWGPPFVLSDARALIDEAVKSCPHATSFELCKSTEGRPVPGLRVEEPGVEKKDRLGIWVQARQHAWESGSCWVCRGFVAWLISDDARARALRQKATINIIPIMDVDNVEQGEGGKNQKPHDHNRDWSDNPVFPAVRAAMKQITAQNEAGRFDLFVDLHNPAASNHQPFFFVAPREILSARGRRNLDSFLQAARLEIRGPLTLAAQPRESGASYDPNWERISKNWVVKHTHDHIVAVTLETAWNTPNSTQTGYQQVGKELGLAIERYFRDPVRK